ncbi:MAG: hypothetical protein QXL15_05205 [Candidatus Korarchaeota archaeon]
MSVTDLDALTPEELESVPYTRLHLSGRIKKLSRDISKLFGSEVSLGVLDIHGEGIYVMSKLRAVSSFISKAVATNAGRLRVGEFITPHNMILIYRINENYFFAAAAKIDLRGRAPEIAHLLQLYSHFIIDYMVENIKYVMAPCEGCKSNVFVPVDIKKVKDMGRVLPFSYFHPGHVLTVYIDPNGAVRGTEVSDILL